jgi:hypothetical protein
MFCIIYEVHLSPANPIYYDYMMPVREIWCPGLSMAVNHSNKITNVVLLSTDQFFERYKDATKIVEFQAGQSICDSLESLKEAQTIIDKQCLEIVELLKD